MTSKPQPQEPVTTAEGHPVPTVIPPASPEAVAAATKAPTEDEYLREFRTYRALTTLLVDGRPAVAAGSPVPASHPHLRDSDERGPGWVSTGRVELTGDYPAPEDLAGAHEAYEASQRPAQTAPGAGTHPGA